ncbi:DUF805 domain-containing protein [Pseudomonas sp. JS3066]|uniref:DUF805 domain-containing protein n=1 Tax=unclassified Pseudomonas TaxID=196821 RepID=UPI00129EF159|nr:MULTISPECIES: DUF805 domain-containing protein [unclassified Pseudomonas]MDH4653513.1 DUF805 domain-containing protein [Pseudomonas sp. BN606]MRK22435.1 DUF805 domain-containing protein [Pseudomonas sp. JG-B]WVK93684.1 DUF805 domain-containing protein [Pseudomonas sp. JS3066]
MTEARFKIVFDGEPMPGVALETVKENLARLFKSDASKIDSLFGGRSVALKRDLVEAEADKYLTALQRAGAMVRKEQDIAAGLSLVATEDHPAPVTAAAAAETSTGTDTMNCPKCGHEQAKAAECQACGIIIDKYLARQAQLTEEAPQVKPSVISSETTSPYAPPRAQVGEQLPEFGELKVLGTSGRIGRVRYLGWSMALMLAFLPIGGVILGSFALSDALAALLTLVACLALVVVSVCIGVQRLHDIGWSGWLWLLNFVPIIGSVFALIMLFMPGTDGPNRYGPPPPPNSRGVKVLAWLIILVPVIGIVAAISLPAYQDYLMRTQMGDAASFEQPGDAPALEGESAE